MKVPARKDISIFRGKIIDWYKKNGRSYPWRETHDPFRILIAEMMLRRTKADQVVPVYEQFFKEYPDVDSLAEAKQEALEKILYPIGLKWRIPAFGMIAREVREKYQSRIPETREELISLPGVGEYVAGAVLSIAYGKKEWLVDSNIVRIFKRYFGIKTSKEGRRDKHVVETAKIYASGKDPGRATMGILDITALVCKPGKPSCEKCPLIDYCYYVLSQRRN
ncbi:MAG: Adenine DNA glycosylase [Syntrophomonadaceae bacterium]|nr:Adenine DNA glycosylase [Bacillota bacterium]MBT9147442.1 Adenine DNA glycosylase [Bacillota bacterium]